MVQIQTSSSAVDLLILAFGSLHLLLAEPYATLRYAALHRIACISILPEKPNREREGILPLRGGHMYDGTVRIVHI
ncbi:hypothetical protein LZ32DRAFT_143449 [Colletotrichum eremochloae]|nr:hypothetical protein LZ32DRAFT_143449 [Colletotrichum eremochloae]